MLGSRGTSTRREKKKAEIDGLVEANKSLAGVSSDDDDDDDLM